MKTILTLTLVLFSVTIINAQTVTAESIKSDINKHEPVNLTGVQIIGDLDLTKLDNMQLQHDDNGSNKTYISSVTSSISFTHCTFTGKVLGYFNPDEEKPYVKHSNIYNTNFNADVNFENCIFEKEVSFKYSVFSAKLSFAGSRFNNDAMFKYTKFEQGPKFNGSIFKNDAIFKYVELTSGFDFSNATFEKVADFKYTKFKDGNFSNSKFKSGGDFKYANFNKSVSFRGAAFEGTSDFKYTTLNDSRTTLNELLSN